MDHHRTDLTRSPAVGRLAPSPTGGLHLGNARTFLIAWLDARSRGGRVVLRIEDIDASRVRPEAIAGAVADLAWLGLDWDEGPVLQSSRLDRYREALDVLKARERVYPCTCTRADIARAASAPHASDEGPTYPGTCAGRSAGDAIALGDRPFAWRFRVPPGLVGWEDFHLGPMSMDPSLVGGDFVVARSNGPPSYQLAVAVDDAAMAVNRVVRGDDLTTSTPRQILLFDSLGLSRPDFGHVPLVVEPDGRRLAKRDQSIKLATIRDRGVDPRRLVGWLARSCGWSAEIEPSRPADWIDRFDWRTIPRGPAVLTQGDLAGLSDSFVGT
jgi:glutamyl-tRNA synthetase